jgi:hypothetical protein
MCPLFSYRISEIYDATRRKLLVASVSIGATGLPTELQRYDCNMHREQTLAGAKVLGPGVAHLVLPTV